METILSNSFRRESYHEIGPRRRRRSGPREYLILHDEHGKIVRYIEIAAEYGDGPRSKKIYSVLTKDSLYVYTVTTEAFLTGDDFIDDTKPATADTMKKSYHIGDLTAIYR